MIRTDREQERRSQRQGSNYFLLTGLVFGLIVGLIFSLGVAPLRYTDADLTLLDSESKDQYRILVALSYQAEQDLGRARERLQQLGSDDFLYDLQMQLAAIQTGDGLTPTWMAMQQLVNDLSGFGGAPVQMEEEPEATPVDDEGGLTPEATQALAMTTDDEGEPQAEPEAEESMESTAVPKETIPPKPTSTTAAAINKPFQLEERLIFCDVSQPQLLQVQIVDEEGVSLQGVPIHISWAGGNETFFTGLYGEVDDGYADFVMMQDVTYRIQVGQSDTFVDNLSPTPCTGDDGSKFYGGWWLSFQP